MFFNKGYLNRTQERVELKPFIRQNTDSLECLYIDDKNRVRHHIRHTQNGKSCNLIKAEYDKTGNLESILIRTDQSKGYSLHGRSYRKSTHLIQSKYVICSHSEESDPLWIPLSDLTASFPDTVGDFVLTPYFYADSHLKLLQISPLMLPESCENVCFMEVLKGRYS